MEKLTGKQARHLRALGHHLKPLMQLGKGGLSVAFLAKLDQALEQHELLKVKLLQNAEFSLAEAALTIEKALNAHTAQKIGKTLLLYRAAKEDPQIHLPEP